MADKRGEILVFRGLKARIPIACEAPAGANLQIDGVGQVAVRVHSLLSQDLHWLVAETLSRKIRVPPPSLAGHPAA
jgi:hypothetical protein